MIRVNILMYTTKRKHRHVVDTGAMTHKAYDENGDVLLNEHFNEPVEVLELLVDLDSAVKRGNATRLQ